MFDATGARRGAQIFVADPRTRRVRQLTRDGGYDPSWSPDGAEIAFERDSSGACPDQACTRIWRMQADGSHRRPITPPEDRCETAAWSPRGDLIAYTQWTAGEEFAASIYVTTVDGSTRKRLTNEPGAFDSDAEWSPDGRQLIFSRYVNDEYTEWMMNADGTGQRRIALKPDVAGVAWSPDGGRFAVWRFHGASEYLIAVSRSDGSGERILIRNGGDAEWAPNGRSIAFIPDNQDIFRGTVGLMQADGTHRHVLLRGRFTQPWHLDWVRTP